MVPLMPFFHCLPAFSLSRFLHRSILLITDIVCRFISIKFGLLFLWVTPFSDFLHVFAAVGLIMGKRKRTGLAAPDNPPSDFMPCPSGRDLTPAEQNFSDPEDSSIFEPLSSVKDIMDIRGKQPNSQFSLGQHHCNLSHAMFLKRSRHHYGNQYSRRNSPTCPRFPSFGKSSPSNDERLCFKYGSRYGSESGNRSDFAEFREKGLWQPERIRTSSSVTEAVSPVGLKTICGICDRPVKWKPRHFGSTISSEELSIVAILVCGHTYHADCLEQRTCPEDIRDPPCPMCLVSLVPKAEAA